MTSLGNAWTAALALAAAIRSRYGTPPTGRQWRRPPAECPPWCAGDHRCTARHGDPAGQHRSKTIMWHTGYGTLSVIAVQHITGRRWVDLAVTVNVDPDQVTDTARMLPPAIDMVIRAVLSGHPDRVVPTPRRARTIGEVRP